MSERSERFDDRLRAAVQAARAAETPAPAADLIERIVAERATGQRIILPVDAPAPHGVRWNRLGFFVATIAAALVVMLTPRVMHRGTPVTAADSISSMDDLLVATAFAEQVARGPALPPVRGLNGARIRAGRYTYRLQYVDSAGRVMPNASGTVDLTAPDANGVMRLVHTEDLLSDEGQRRIQTESLTVAADGLRILTRNVHVRPYRRFTAINVAQQLFGDSVRGVMTTDRGIRRTFARQFPRAYAPFISDAIAPFALMGVRLDAKWRGSLSVVGWAVIPSDFFVPVSLRVIGDEKITTALGTFDCWKLSVDAGAEHRTEWVRKTDGLGLRATDDRETPKGHRQFELTHVE